VRKVIDTYTEGEDPEDRLFTNWYLDLSYSRVGQDVRYALDDSKLRSLGWEPQAEFDKELKGIVEYYKNKFIW
jgi:dTDP-D-glucose 4,6-dehydratase